MAEALGAKALLEWYAPYFDLLSPAARIFVNSGRDGAEPGIELDAFLQGTLLENIEIPLEILDITEAEVRGSWDPELAERTLGWIAKHRAKHAV